MNALKSFEENSSGMSAAGSPDPERWQLLLAGPPIGMVRVPLSLAVQCDSRQPYVTCHGRLEATDDGPQEPGIDVSELLTCCSVMGANPPRAIQILWSIKLMPSVLVGGEYFVPVSGFPLIHGTVLAVGWSYATGYDAVRTRAVCVDVPIEAFDWSKVTPLQGTPQHRVVEHRPQDRPTDFALASLPLWPAIWRYRRMGGRGR